jgi:hypothetical protein
LNRQGCAHRTFGIVFVCARKSKIDKHAVAEKLRDVTVESFDRARAHILISVDDVAVVCGIEPLRERGGSDQIAEHHRQLTPFTGGGRNLDV